jgi:hypothetical protein
MVPDLTLDAAVAVPPVLPDAADARVQVYRNDDGSVAAFCHTRAGRHWIHLPGLASFHFPPGADCVTAIADPAARPDLLREAFLRRALPLALHALGREVLHASAVLMPAGAVPLCAASGTGKSTLAYGLSRRGYPLSADDADAFHASAEGVRTVPLPFRIRLRPSAASYFGPAAAPPPWPRSPRRWPPSASSDG